MLPGSLAWIWACAFVLVSTVSAEPPADLAAVLEEALKLEVSRTLLPAGHVDMVDEGSSWLAAPPVFSASYLASNRTWGTDETELSVSLPLQSPEHRRRNEELRRVDPQLAEAAAALRRWQLSGWLRDIYADRQRGRLALALAEAEQQALESLAERAQAQKQAGSLPPYDLWVIEQELRAARTRVARQQAALDKLADSYVELTGLSQWPPRAGESGSIPAAPGYENHPQARFMRALSEQGLAAVRAGSASLTPWSFGLVGREFSMSDRTEWQYGVSLNIPLGTGKVAKSVAVSSGERTLRRQFFLELDAWRAALRRRWAEVDAEREALLEEQRLLAADEALAAVGRQLETLQVSGEIPIENRVQRRLALLRAQRRPAIVEAEIEATEALLRQLAGESL